MSSEPILVGKNALVTASSHGIGKHIALALADEGANVAINYRSDPDAGHQLRDQITEKGVEALAIPGDLTDPEANRRLIRETMSAFGSIDILINNVGEYGEGPVRQHPDQDFQRIIAGTIGSTFYATKAALPHMRSQGWGRIVNLGAAGAEHAASAPGMGVHMAGKSAVASLTRTLAKEEGEAGITVNLVSPGVIDDKERSRREARRQTTNTGSVKRPGTSQDVVDAVLFLVRPDSDYITGAAITVSGGWRI